jgi:hypothetical protein
MSDDEKGVKVNLDVEIPPFATEQQVALYDEMADIFADQLATFISKNLDYGSSFLTAGQVDEIFGGGAEAPFDSADEANLYKLFTRIQDKDQRFYQQVFCNGDNLVNEDAAETAGDAGVYWFMVQWLLTTEMDTHE